MRIYQGVLHSISTEFFVGIVGRQATALDPVGMLDLHLLKCGQVMIWKTA
jgi:hypothetical protein